MNQLEQRIAAPASTPSPIDLSGIGLGRQAYLALVDGDDLRPGRSVDVTIVIVTHESRPQIIGCLASLFDVTDHTTFEVVVVDNASTDGSADLVVAEFPSVRVIRKHGRHGFSTNVNIGASAAGGRHVLMLNPDTIVPSGSIDALTAHLDDHPEVGVVGPRLLYPDGTDQASARRFPSPLTAAVRRTPLRRLLPSIADGHLCRDLDEHGTEDVDWMLGAALLVRATAIDSVGGLDDGFRLYCEDIDLCWRLHEAGWRVQHRGDLTVEHELGDHTRKHLFTRRTLWHYRSMFRFVRMHGLGRPEATERNGSRATALPVAFAG